MHMIIRSGRGRISRARVFCMRSGVGVGRLKDRIVLHAVKYYFEKKFKLKERERPCGTDEGSRLSLRKRKRFQRKLRFDGNKSIAIEYKERFYSRRNSEISVSINVFISNSIRFVSYNRYFNRCTLLPRNKRSFCLHF